MAQNRARKLCKDKEWKSSVLTPKRKPTRVSRTGHDLSGWHNQGYENVQCHCTVRTHSTKNGSCARTCFLVVSLDEVVKTSWIDSVWQRPDASRLPMRQHGKRSETHFVKFIPKNTKPLLFLIFPQVSGQHNFWADSVGIARKGMGAKQACWQLYLCLCGDQVEICMHRFLSFFVNEIQPDSRLFGVYWFQ